MTTNNVELNKLTVEDWLESYQLRTQNLINRHLTGPLNPDQGGAGSDVVRGGAYLNWHYDALAMLQLLEKVIELQGREKKLQDRVRLLERVIQEDKSDEAPQGE